MAAGSVGVRGRGRGHAVHARPPPRRVIPPPGRSARGYPPVQLERRPSGPAAPQRRSSCARIGSGKRLPISSEQRRAPLRRASHQSRRWAGAAWAARRRVGGHLADRDGAVAAATTSVTSAASSAAVPEPWSGRGREGGRDRTAAEPDRGPSADATTGSPPPPPARPRSPPSGWGFSTSTSAAPSARPRRSEPAHGLVRRDPHQAVRPRSSASSRVVAHGCSAC